MSVEPHESSLRDVIDALTQRVAILERVVATVAPPRRLLPMLPARMPDAPDPVALESRLGGYWFARLGIVSLVTGLALLVAHGFDDFSPALKAVLGYAVAGALVAAGRWVSRRFRGFGQILFAGGLGVGYFTSYAIHHVPSVQLITSPELGFALLAANVIVIVAVAQAMQSQTVAGVALFLGLHTGMVSEVGTFTLLSSCLLAAGASFFLVRNRWVVVPLSTMIAVYTTHAGWMLGNPLGSGAGIVHTDGHLATSLAFVAIYFGTFALALSISTRELSDRARAAFGLINWAATAALASFEMYHHRQSGLQWWFAALGGASLVMAAIGSRRHGRDLGFHTHLALAGASAALAAWVVVDGNTLVMMWCGVSVVFAAIAVKLSSRPLSIVASLVTGLALAFALSNGANDPGVAAALIAALVIQERLLASAGPGPLAQSWHRLERWVAPAAVAAVMLTVAGNVLASSLITVAWVGSATALFATGLLLRAISYRLAALGAFGIAFVRLFLIDLGGLSAGARIIAFLVLGALFLAVSFVYIRRGERDNATSAEAGRTDGGPE